MSIKGIQRWLTVQASVALPLLGLAVWLGSAHATATLVVAAAFVMVSYAFLWRVLDAGGKVADRVTLARLLGLLVILVATAGAGRVTWAIWCGAAAVAASDLLDGYCARRFGGSEAGALLDMETDQFTTLGLSLAAYCAAGVGFFVLLLPAFRYGSVLWMLARGLPAYDPKPCDGDNRRGRLVCALVVVLLLTAILPIAPALLRTSAGLLAVAALCYSFGSDAWYLLRARRKASVA